MENGACVRPKNGAYMGAKDTALWARGRSDKARQAGGVCPPAFGRCDTLPNRNGWGTRDQTDAGIQERIDSIYKLDDSDIDLINV